jgi:uncharacterized protein
MRTTAIAITMVLAAAAADAKTFAWKVAGKGGAVYLVGSVHLLSSDFYPLPPSLDAAYKDSDLLLEEVDMAELTDPVSQMALLSKGMLPSSTPLDTVISPATYALLTKRAEALGVPAAPFKMLKPWMAALTLVQLEWQQAGFDPQLGLDKHFYDLANSNGKEVIGLETAESQVDRFDKMPERMQEQMLRSELAEMETEQTGLRALLTAWRTGDSAAIEKMLLGSFSDNPAAYNSLITERNRNWMPQLETCLRRSSPCFVVVGAAHVVGPQGLLAMLQQRGYRIEQQ